MEILHDGPIRQPGGAPSPSNVDATPDAAEPARSPGLRAGAASAFELKFELSQDDVRRMNAWARRHLCPDPHGKDGRYPVTSVYCDTPEFDVFHLPAGDQGSKLRLRRYGSAPFVFLERKLKHGDRVHKRRVEIALEDLQRLAACVEGGVPPAGWPGGWFLDHAVKMQLAPTCRVGYRRTAFYGRFGPQSVRLTIDESLIGVPARGWEVHPLREGLELMPGGALLELKFQDDMPELFRRLLADLPPRTASISKYRRCVRVCGLAQDRSAGSASC